MEVVVVVLVDWRVWLEFGVWCCGVRPVVVCEYLWCVAVTVWCIGVLEVVRLVCGVW